MIVRTFIALIALLINSSVLASDVNYVGFRKWVEERCETNATPKEDRLFVGRFDHPTYAGILRFHDGMTIREVIDQSPLKGRTVLVLVLRPTDRPFHHMWFTVWPSDRPHYELKRLDVIWLYDDGPIITT
jgi:hypothetical protein